MKLGKFLFHIFSNAIALIVAAYFVVDSHLVELFLRCHNRNHIDAINVFIKPLFIFMGR